MKVPFLRVFPLVASSQAQQTDKNRIRTDVRCLDSLSSPPSFSLLPLPFLLSLNKQANLHLHRETNTKHTQTYTQTHRNTDTQPRTHTRSHARSHTLPRTHTRTHAHTTHNTQHTTHNTQRNTPHATHTKKKTSLHSPFPPTDTDRHTDRHRHRSKLVTMKGRQIVAHWSPSTCSLVIVRSDQ